MELALPILALGGLYVISNQKPASSKKHENFQNLKQNQYLPNTMVPPQNYPVLNKTQLIDTVQEYPNPKS